MITLQELEGNQKLYDQILKQLKRKVSIFKRGSIKEISRTAAAECEILCIHNVELENLEFLRFFPRLSLLQLDDITGLKSIEGISHCNLQTLCLMNVNIEHFEQLAMCPSLKNFSYDYEAGKKVNPCTDLSFVKELPNLESLFIPGIEGDISPLLQCYSLQVLCIAYTPIGSIEQFSILPRLRELYVDGCGLNGKVDLSVFPHLQTISLSENGFTLKQREELLHKYPKIKIQIDR